MPLALALIISPSRQPAPQTLQTDSSLPVLYSVVFVWCVYVCTHVHVCACLCTFVFRPDVNTEYLSQLLLYLVFETGSLPETRS